MIVNMPLVLFIPIHWLFILFHYFINFSFSSSLFQYYLPDLHILFMYFHPLVIFLLNVSSLPPPSPILSTLLSYQFLFS